MSREFLMKTPGKSNYVIQYALSVVTHDIPALPKNVRESVKNAISERLTADPVGLGKPLRYSPK